MPSCEPASSTDNWVLLRSAARADRLASALSSRRWRRAASNANSTATKNALRTMSPTVTATTIQGLLTVALHVLYRHEYRGGHTSVHRSNRDRQHLSPRRRIRDEVG